MSATRALLVRNVKLFFKDRGMFFTSLITPAILLVLYVSFLGNVYEDSFLSALPEGLVISQKLIDALVGGQLISSILAVSCVTVAFCSNFLIVQDRANGTVRDLSISPAKSSSLAVSYYLASLFSTLIICLAATAICLFYVSLIGWYLTLSDVLYLLLDVVLLTLFGTALSSVINGFLSTQGQISAVGTVVSAGYGFLCGAYMPIASFDEGLQKVLSFLPGTHGTVLMRRHCMESVLAKMGEEGLPDAAVTALKDAMDCNLYLFDELVSAPVMYAVLGITTLLLILAYVLIHKLRAKT
ncbi:MAG: ABC transporter permease [Clostridia bacterium]|nr:ABC transporter permease [Clostridia bacterium]